MDFTIKQYLYLIESLQNAGFFFQTFAGYTLHPNARGLILRHDVDAKPENSLRFARIQSEMGIVGTYYFRMVPQSFDIQIIKEIEALGHEVGYHYETMDSCRGDVDKAYDEFRLNLETFRKLTEIKTISMHGSPLSKYDNRDIWKKYDYKKLGILAEPYFDIDFNKLYYLTDTGRRWDGHLYNLRDKATKENPITNPDFLKLQFRSTNDIIKAVLQRTTNNEQQATNNKQRTTNNKPQIERSSLPRLFGEIPPQRVPEQIFPKRAMLNFHPQRWNDGYFPWLKELVFQNIKNQAKRILILLGR